MAQARIISRIETPRYSAGGHVDVETRITYVIGIQPPRTIGIMAKDPSDAEVAAAIRADQARPAAGSPQIIEI